MEEEEVDVAANILIVEGDAGTAQTMHDLLELQGYRAVALMDPEQAAEVAREVRPDLVIVSLMVPPLTGIEVAERLRDAGYRDVPIIATTTSTLMEEVGEAADLFGDILVYDSTIRQPDIDRLIETVATQLGKRTG